MSGPNLQHLKRDEYAIYLNEVPIVRGKIFEGMLLTNEIRRDAPPLQIPFITSKNTLGMPSLWVDEKYQEILQKAGIKFWTALEVMILHLSYFYRQYASEFIGIQEVRGDLRIHRKIVPRPRQRGHPPGPSPKAHRNFRTTRPRTGLDQRSPHHPRSPQRMGPNRKRYRPPHRICPLLSQALHQLQVLSRPIGSLGLSARSRNRRYGPRRDQTNLCRLLSRPRPRFGAS